jgi:glycosyltransferase involved in cell wall biosynthesis
VDDGNGQVWAITMVRDEEDIVRATVGNMITQVDRVLVADNLSRDNTRMILNQLAYRYPKQLEVINDDEPGYYQSRKMTDLALRAYEAGATWVVPFDADEYWVGSIGTIAETLRAHEDDYGIVTAELYDHVATRLDPTAGDIIDKRPWRRDYPLELPKVACRTSRDMLIAQGNHDVKYLDGLPVARTPTPRLTVHHYPYRTLEQFVHKIRNGADAYAATDLPATVGQHWRQWGEMTDDELAGIFHEYYWREQPDWSIQHPYDPTEYPPLIRDIPRRVRV